MEEHLKQATVTQSRSFINVCELKLDNIKQATQANKDLVWIEEWWQIPRNPSNLALWDQQLDPSKKERNFAEEWNGTCRRF